ncbi:MAG: DNA polymerase III subunit delta [Arenibacterium sp.]
MKLSTRDAARYFAKPEADKTGLLIYGADAMRIALKRKQVIEALIGPGGEDEMRLSRIAAGDVRKDAALLLDELKATGFFPGPRVVHLEDANDAVSSAVTTALEAWQQGDAQLVVTAGALKASSKIRKLFEGHRNAYAIGLYDDPPGREEIERMLVAAGLRNVPGDTLAALTALSRDIGPGDFAQVLEKLSLYKMNDSSPLGVEDVAACAPGSTEAALDDILNVVAEARSQEIAPLMRRLQSQGTTPVSLCIGATRHFRVLFMAASHPGGVSEGVARLRPPVFGPRRDRLSRQAQNWGVKRLQSALSLLTDTDLQLRSAGQAAPAMAVMERALIRLAMLGTSR